MPMPMSINSLINYLTNSPITQPIIHPYHQRHYSLLTKSITNQSTINQCISINQSHGPPQNLVPQMNKRLPISTLIQLQNSINRQLHMNPSQYLVLTIPSLLPTNSTALSTPTSPVNFLSINGPISSGNISAANKTGAVEIPACKSDNAGLPMMEADPVKSSMSSTSWKATPM